MSREYKDDKDCLDNNSKNEVDGGTVIVAYLMIAICIITFCLTWWFGVGWLTGI